MAAVYLGDGRRMLTEGEVEFTLARQADEIARRDAEIERLRRLLEERR